jgi:hypothetical protein
MTIRDRIEEAAKALLREIDDAAFDDDLTADVRSDLKWLHLGIENALNGFNQPTGPDLSTGCGPTDADIAGEVDHV